MRSAWCVVQSAARIANWNFAIGIYCAALLAPAAASAQDTHLLVVAIPAVWIYNYLTARIEYFNVEMDNSSSELVDYFIKKTA